MTQWRAIPRWQVFRIRVTRSNSVMSSFGSTIFQIITGLSSLFPNYHKRVRPFSSMFPRRHDLKYQRNPQSREILGNRNPSRPAVDIDSNHPRRPK
jgi:hypothetical protein